ncbi:RagB/SusD family nutrient uptake outer membrane protein [Pedobacter psychrodurus]|uniref:RagB/SusD family nutrient uptake outer membrane protein n=1 Tax=Pedobacter psychrodurus TaxID=2530456 RepID=A0A4R0Q9V8_9SPHI|nr:RagB/SusD family nutrient uptake outer membrane protein [Pedobacter psychrodurus]TCD28714.1 RagB/SusD family nutrient uptake outer membrane protein [Pedobacter psychrodurus]
MKRYLSISTTMLLIFGFVACKKFVQLDPPDDRLNYSTAYSTNTSATSVLNGLYIRIMESATVFSPNSTTYLSTAGDEMKSFFISPTSIYSNLYRNEILPVNELYWSSTYTLIYHCNAAIEGLEESNTINSGLKQQLIGEAKFMRAFCYFYLVNTYGGVPLLTSPDYRVNATAPRADVSAVYAQMITDLTDAKSKLSRDFLKGDAMTAYPVGSSERVRPTFWAASALLSRVYLYNRRWAEADIESSAVINNAGMFSLVSPAQVFQKNSRESIFQMEAVSAINYSLPEARLFVLSTSVGTSSFPIAMSNQLIQAFEVNDQRRVNWVGNVTIGGVPYQFPYKYKANTAASAISKPEYLSLLRLGEQYLIRAEARLQQNNLSGALADVNTIRSRAGLSNTTASSQNAIFEAILKERQTELFCEQGHRWFDLKRTGKLDEVMTSIAPTKGSQWASYKQLFPIPTSDIIANPSLIQNPGYN